MRRRTLLALISLMLAGCGGGLLPATQVLPTASPPERSTVRIGSVALNAFIQLPLALAHQFGYFSAAGVDVQLIDYPNGNAALSALGRGEVDVVSIPYEFTIRAQMTGTAVRMVALYDLRPGLVLSVGKPHADAVRSMKDLVGKPVCVTAVATASEGFVRWLASREGIDPASIPIRSCGIASERYAAGLASGEFWAAQQVDPPFTRLERAGTAKLLYDTRSERTASQVYGGRGVYPANGLIAPRDFLQKYPNTVSALVAALVKALRYIHSHTAKQVAADMPSSFKEGDPELYASSLSANVGMFSSDGIVPADGPPKVLQVLQLILPGLSASQIDIAQTYDNTFVRKANGGG